MSFRGRGRLAGLFASALLSLICSVRPSAQTTAAHARPPTEAHARPNVLFITVDDLNSWVGALGSHPSVRTPNLDRLARRSLLFTRAYPAAPSCNPSRTALLTGVRPSTSGVYENDNPWRPVLPDAVTLPQYFMRHGYEVVGAGKIFHNTYNDPASWHRYYDIQPSPAPARRPANGLGRAHFDWSPVEVGDEEMGDYKVVSWALERWAERRERPLFLAVGLIRPHLPWYVPRKYFEEYPLEQVRLPEVRPDDLDDIPAAGRALALRLGDHKSVVEAGQWRKAVQGYLASISFADAMVGRLLDAVERSPQARNTIIVLMGDHGWNLGEKQHWRKFALWEETTRTTLMVSAPGVTKGGATCSRTVNLMDLYPTLVELAGLPKKEGLEAVSLLPLLRRPSGVWDRPSLMTYQRGNHAVRSERWRYIRYSDGGEELYDHRADPHEWKNSAGDPRYERVKAELKRWLPERDAPTAPQVRQVE